MYTRPSDRAVDVTFTEAEAEAVTTCNRRRLWTWRDARLLALAILQEAEERRRILVEDDARRYRESEAAE